MTSMIVFLVIGSQGTVISSIQDESGARVRIVRPPKDKGKGEVEQRATLW